MLIRWVCNGFPNCGFFVFSYLSMRLAIYSKDQSTIFTLNLVFSLSLWCLFEEWQFLTLMYLNLSIFLLWLTLLDLSNSSLHWGPEGILTCWLLKAWVLFLTLIFRLELTFVWNELGVQFSSLLLPPSLPFPLFFLFYILYCLSTT